MTDTTTHPKVVVNPRTGRRNLQSERCDGELMRPFPELGAKVTTEEATDRVPAAKYVNLLFVHAIRGGQSELLLRESDVLPTLSRLFGADGKTDLPHADLLPPTFNVISNRLKVMAGCIPMKHKALVCGTIRFRVDGTEYAFTAQLDDTAHEPFCKVTLKGEMSQPSSVGDSLTRVTRLPGPPQK